MHQQDSLMGSVDAQIDNKKQDWKWNSCILRKAIGRWSCGISFGLMEGKLVLPIIGGKLVIPQRLLGKSNMRGPLPWNFLARLHDTPFRTLPRRDPISQSVIMIDLYEVRPSDCMHIALKGYTVSIWHGQGAAPLHQEQ